MAQLVEHNLAKVGVAGSNPVVRSKHRSEFNQRIFRGDPEATKEAWQRYYFKGEFPEEVDAPAPQGHVNKRRLKAPKFG